ncbi:hypothetical protein Pelo_11743 [Pelomyxa schiedti]|nr:hypothetical protein Pelo_11743 [Pelomyxa schiedti]
MVTELCIVFDSCENSYGATSLVRVLTGDTFLHSQEPTRVDSFVKYIPHEDPKVYSYWPTTDGSDQWRIIGELEKPVEILGVKVTLRDTPKIEVTSNSYGSPCTSDLGCLNSRFGHTAYSNVDGYLKKIYTIFVILYSVGDAGSAQNAIERAGSIAAEFSTLPDNSAAKEYPSMLDTHDPVKALVATKCDMIPTAPDVADKNLQLATDFCSMFKLAHFQVSSKDKTGLDASFLETLVRASCGL